MNPIEPPRGVRRAPLAVVVGLLCCARAAHAYPRLESRIEVRIPSGEPDGAGYMTFFQDHESASTYWWAPFRLQLARIPGRGSPWLKWTPYADVPRLSFALEMTPLVFAEQEIAKRDLAAQVHRGEDELELRALSFEQITLQAQETSGSPFLFSGEWKPVTSLFPWIIAETIALAPDQNDLLLRATEGHSYVPLALNVSAEFYGYRDPKRFMRTYAPACLAAQIRGRRTDAEVLSMRWSPMKLYSVKYAIERSCVTLTTILGPPPTLDERLGDWDQELVDLGLLQREGARFKVTSVQAIDGFQGAARSLETSNPEPLEAFPVAFGVFVTQLRAHEE